MVALVTDSAKTLTGREPSRATVVPRIRHVAPAGIPDTPDTPASPATPRKAPVLGPLGLLTVLLGAALPLIDFFIVNVALPTIERDLNAGESVLEMVVAGYGVSYAVLLVLGGRLGDTYGRRRLFLWGLALFGLTSLACGLAPDAWTLVAARVAQGAASALMLPQVLATIHAATSGDRRGKALGLYGATGGISSVAGQLLGGLLVSANLLGTGWRAIFLVNVPVAAVALLLALRTVPDSRSEQRARSDIAGTVLLAASLIALLLPLTEGRAAGWPVWSWALLIAAPFLAWAFYAVERRGEATGGSPLLPPSLLREPALRTGLAIGLPLFLGFGGFMFVVAVALQQGLSLGPVAAGMALVPMCAAFFAASLTGPRLIPKHGRRVMTWGALIQGAGLALLGATVLWRWPDLGPLGMAPGMAVLGFGQGLQLPTYFRVVLGSVPAERAGAGSGLAVTNQQSCLALGVAILGSLFLTLAPSIGVRDALLTAFGVQLAGIAATALLSLRLPRSVA
ncbi:MFS transporter [Streptomyces sp. A7024]|uniref:MFS transporter n=1 Tax=Streptomyces coryli TaxID=1128680 RepID=A0A6G4U0G2_9ACTN|nr:MFS transporter [Streptomyces coryli]NGN65196.1 MFS transporter [Streptomyces coryli]